MKRKTPILLLTMLFSLVLAACGGQEAVTPSPADVTAAELARTVAESQEDLAGLVGVRRETIVNLERGKYNPSLKLALKICAVLEARVEDLFWLEG